MYGMKDFAGNDLKLGDSVITLKVGGKAMVAGEVTKLTPNGAKITTFVVIRHGVIWRESVNIQRDSLIIHLVERNPTREAELTAQARPSI